MEESQILSYEREVNYVQSEIQSLFSYKEWTYFWEASRENTELTRLLSKYLLLSKRWFMICITDDSVSLKLFYLAFI